jgi:hypothetical protein
VKLHTLIVGDKEKKQSQQAGPSRHSVEQLHDEAGWIGCEGQWVGIGQGGSKAPLDVGHEQQEKVVEERAGAWDKESGGWMMLMEGDKEGRRRRERKSLIKNRR